MTGTPTAGHRRFGEGQYDDTERVIRVLLKESGATGPTADPIPISAEGIEAAPGRDVRTPETYVGYRRAERFSSPQRIARDSRKTYAAPARLGLNHWCLNGAWEVGAESGLLREAHGKLVFLFHSRDLHLVLGPTETGKPVPFRVTLQGAAPGSDAGTDSSRDGVGEVREPRLYQLIRQKGQVEDRLFEIEFLRFRRARICVHLWLDRDHRRQPRLTRKDPLQIEPVEFEVRAAMNGAEGRC
jgi:hypothetical protein